MSDYALWRDFDWESYLESELKRYSTEKERDELRSAVALVREYLRVFSSSRSSRAYIRQILALEAKHDLRTFSHALCIAAQFANVMSNAGKKEEHKLNFAITAISHAAKRCKEGRFEKVLPILTRFAKEFSD